MRRLTLTPQSLHRSGALINNHHRHLSTAFKLSFKARVKNSYVPLARQSDSLKSLGLDPKKGTEKFNKMLRKPPSEAASDILNAVKKNKRRVLVGNDAKAMDALQRLMPTGYQRIFSKAIKMAK